MHAFVGLPYTSIKHPEYEKVVCINETKSRPMEVVERGMVRKTKGSGRPPFEFDRDSVVPQYVASLHLLKGVRRQGSRRSMQGFDLKHQHIVQYKLLQISS